VFKVECMQTMKEINNALFFDRVVNTQFKKCLDRSVTYVAFGLTFQQNLKISSDYKIGM